MRMAVIHFIQYKLQGLLTICVHASHVTFVTLHMYLNLRSHVFYSRFGLLQINYYCYAKICLELWEHFQSNTVVKVPKIEKCSLTQTMTANPRLLLNSFTHKYQIHLPYTKYSKSNQNYNSYQPNDKRQWVLMKSHPSNSYLCCMTCSEETKNDSCWLNM